MNENKPRKPATALTMSFVLPGLGQLYNGELNKAIWLFFTITLLCIPGIALAMIYLPDSITIPTLALGIVAALVLWLYSMIDAWRTARTKQAYLTERWQVSGVYLLAIILCDVLTLPLLIGFMRTHVVESYSIPSSSMEPGVMKGDILFADKQYNCPGCKESVQRGDIAIFVHPNDRNRLYIKRIVALPGDLVTIRGTLVSVNGNPLATPTNPAFETEYGRSWVVRPAKLVRRGKDIAVTVPNGEVYVLGDNRATSRDSRAFGTVPIQNILGRARQIWLSLDESGIRWDRLGKILR